MTDADLHAKAAPPTAFTIGAYRFARQGWYWEANGHGRGVGGYRTPWGAFFALRRWLRQPARPQ